jgi:ABC-type phosphate/phosphonate transport system substrate-binding protein
MQWWQAGLGIVLGMALSTWEPRLIAADPAAADIKIGVVESMFRDIPPKGVEVVLQKFTDLVELQTGFRVQIEVAGDAHALGKMVSAGKYQMGVFNGFEFAWAREKAAGLKPLLIAINRQREVTAHLIVRKDAPYQDITGLQGKVLIQHWRCRAFARLFLERHCLARAQVLPTALFGTINTEIASPEEALDLVVDKEADAAILDGASLELYKKNNPNKFKNIRDLCMPDCFPASVLAYNKDALTEKQVECFEKGMLNANQSAKGKEMMKWCGMTSFESIPENYEAMLKTVMEKYPPVPPQSVPLNHGEEVKSPEK